MSEGESRFACILCREATDGGPIEALAALGEEPEKSVVQQAAKRHRYPQRLGRRQREADILVSERRGESRRLKLAIGDQATVGLVSRRGEDCRGQQIHVAAPVDAGLADERDGLAQGFDGGGEQEVPAELDEIRRRRLRTDWNRLLSQRLEQRLAGFDRNGGA